MIPTGVSMVVSGGAVSPENRSNEAGLAALIEMAPQSGPWRYQLWNGVDRVICEADAPDVLVAVFELDTDAMLAAAAVNALPSLLARIAAVEAELAKLPGDIVREIDQSWLRYKQTPGADHEHEQRLTGAMSGLNTARLIVQTAFRRAALAASPTPTADELQTEVDRAMLTPTGAEHEHDWDFQRPGRPTCRRCGCDYRSASPTPTTTEEQA